MKTLLLAFLLALFAVPALFAQTTINAGTVSGTWTLAGSPYIIQGDILVPPTLTLRIEAGVEVRFAGHYNLEVRGGLRVLGTPDKHVLFHAADTTGWSNDATTAGGWRGMWLREIGPGDSSVVQYADIHDVKNWMIFVQRKITFDHCEASHNRNKAGAVFQLGTNDGQPITLTYCDISGNVADYGVIACLSATTRMDHSYLHHNTSGGYGIMAAGCSLILEDNEIAWNHGVPPACAVMMMDGEVVTVLRNKIHHNSSGNTGALHIKGKNVNVSHNFFFNNSLQDGSACGITDGGGAMHLTGGMVGGKPYLIRNNVFANNFSDFMGGAIACNGVDGVFANNTLVNNQSSWFGAVVSNVGGSALTFRNNIFKGNITAVGIGTDSLADIYVMGICDLRFDYNLADARPFQLVGGPGATWIGDTSHHVYKQDPGLVAPTTAKGLAANATIANFSQGPKSFANNRGDSAGAYCLPKDIVAAARFVGKLDIGAYEHPNPNSIPETAPRQEALLQVYPNPARDRLFIKTAERGTLQLLDARGGLVQSWTVSGPTTAVSVQALPAGRYFLSIAGRTAAVPVTIAP